MVTETVIEVKVGTQTATLLQIEWHLVGPSETKPTPSSGFTMISVPIEIDGVKMWIEWKPL